MIINFTFLINFTVAILYILIVKRFELYMDFALYKINILLLLYAKSKKSNLDSLVRDNVILTPGKGQAENVPLPTSDEIPTSYQKLSSTGSKAAVLRVVPEHGKAFRPTVLANKVPPVLTDLFEQSHSKLPFNELVNKCDEIEITVTQEQAKCVMQATKTQSTNKQWFRFRSGRVTASKIKRICRSNPDQPSQYIIAQGKVGGDDAIVLQATEMQRTCVENNYNCML